MSAPAVERATIHARRRRPRARTAGSIVLDAARDLEAPARVFQGARARSCRRPTWKPRTRSSPRSAAHFPEHAILGEESGAHRRRARRQRLPWLVDPDRRRRQFRPRLSGLRGLDRARARDRDHARGRARSRARRALPGGRERQGATCNGARCTSPRASTWPMRSSARVAAAARARGSPPTCPRSRRSSRIAPACAARHRARSRSRTSPPGASMGSG